MPWEEGRLASAEPGGQEDMEEEQRVATVSHTARSSWMGVMCVVCKVQRVRELL